MYETVSKVLRLRYEKVLVAPAWVKIRNCYQRLDQAIRFYHLPNPYAVSARKIKTDLLRASELVEEVNYLKSLNVSSLAELNARLQKLQQQKKAISGERFNLEGIYNSLSEAQKQKAEEYERLEKEYEVLYEQQDDAWEEADDKLQELRKALPDALLDAQDRIDDLKEKDKTLWKEQKLIERILEGEGR